MCYALVHVSKALNLKIHKLKVRTVFTRKSLPLTLFSLSQISISNSAEKHRPGQKLPPGTNYFTAGIQQAALAGRYIWKLRQTLVSSL